MLPFAKTTYLKSVGNLSQLPNHQGIEIAFAGRSNAGKSSALNAITGIRNLAKTSKTPGRTQTINLFEVTSQLFLVDLPGYGYAKVSPKVKYEWDKLLSTYLSEREHLRGLILFMDIRHPLQSFDQHLLSWAVDAELPIHLVLTKADKLSRGAATQVLHQLQQRLTEYPDVSMQLFSAVTGEGIVQVQKKIAGWCAT